ncbi:hypothetical protein GCM10025868_27170 [Angustibacter aerolatus]|uniref:CBM6 domain-containing protein n=1 Tax=Angustibacter aerolatus TaxID=1162965 RepID=A0ABQ6JKT6_9ACTN|nr:hypothetical protein GCM10025868_27170 [Angustibacter aerolatus]
MSWSLDKGAIDTWQDAADGWRIDTDVECYCDTLVAWTNSVDDRFADAPSWVRYAGKGGWNNLDSLDVGNGRMDGLTDDERRSYATLWAISAAPLYTGDDLTKLDRLGRQLLTNREVLAIDAQGRAASPVVPKALQQVWRVQNADGSWTVALFNLDRQPAHVQARWSDVGFAGPARVRDVWSGRSLGRFAGGWSADVPGHGVRLLNVRPEATPVTVQAESSTSTLVGGAKVGGCDGCAGGLKVGDMGEGDSVTLHGFHVARAGTYAVTVSYVDASNGRDVGIAVDGGAVQKVRLGAGDDDRWDRPQSTTLHLPLRAGENSITFSNVGGYTPDVDQVTVQRVVTAADRHRRPRPDRGGAVVRCGSGADVGREVLAGEGRAVGDQVGGGALEDDAAAVVPGAGAEVDDPVGVRHHRLVVLDDDHRRAAVDQAVEQAEQAARRRRGAVRRSARRARRRCPCRPCASPASAAAARHRTAW